MPDQLNDFLDGKIAPSEDSSRGEAIRRGAKELGIDPIDYATVMSYESAGSFDPWKAGPTTKWGQHRGTIQYGEPQRKQYGVYEGQPFEDQVTTSNVEYLRDKGVKPGATLLDIYKAINGGSVNASENASDGYDQNGKRNTIIGHVEKMSRDHRPQVVKRFFSNDLDGFLDGGKPSPKDAPAAQSNKNALDSFLDAPVSTANTSLAVGEGTNVTTDLATGEITLKNGTLPNPAKPTIPIPKLGVPVNPVNPNNAMIAAQIPEIAAPTAAPPQKTGNPSEKFLDQYNTALSAADEQKFQQWALSNYGSPDRLNGELGNYDLRGAWQELQSGKSKVADNGHLPDKFKKPNHITFSDESQYANGDGGKWQKIGGKWQFTPSKQTLELYGADGLKNYFAEQEKDANLNLSPSPSVSQANSAPAAPPFQPSVETEAREIADLPTAQIGQTFFGANYPAQTVQPPAAALPPNYLEYLKARELPDSPELRNEYSRVLQESQTANGNLPTAENYNQQLKAAESHNAAAQEAYQRQLAEYNAKKLPDAQPPTSVLSQSAPTAMKTGTAENIQASENNGRSITIDLRNVSGDKSEFINAETAKQIAAEFDVPEADALEVLRKYPLMHGDGTAFTPDEVTAQETTSFKLTPALIAEIRQNTEARKAAAFQAANAPTADEQFNAGAKKRDDELRAQAEENIRLSPFSGGTDADIEEEYQLLKKSRLSAESERKARNVGGNLNDLLGENAGGLVGGVLGSGGRAFKGLAGIARPFTNFGLGSEALYRQFSKIAQYNEIAEESSGGDGTISKLLKIGGALPGDLARFSVLSRLPGGTVVGFAADSALQSSGAGDSVDKVIKSGIKGAALGATFGVADKAGKVVSGAFGKNALALADAFPSNALYKTVSAAKSVVREGVELGTIAGGTMTIEKLAGSTDEQAAQSAIFNALFHVVGKVQGKALDKIYKIWNGGKSANVYVDPSGRVKLLTGEVEPNYVDAEIITDPQSSAYKASENAKRIGRGTPEKEFDAQTPGNTPNNNLNDYYPNASAENRLEGSIDAPRELSAQNPQRIEAAQPEALEKVTNDARSQKVIENLRDGKIYTVEQIQKATRFNKTNVEETLLNLYAARQIEILPDNSVRFIGSETQSPSKSLFERASDITAPAEPINLPQSSVENEISSSDFDSESPSNGNLQRTPAFKTEAGAKNDLPSNEKDGNLSIYEALPQQKQQESKTEKPKAKLDYKEPENIAEKLNVFTERGTKAQIEPRVVEQTDLLTSLDEGYPPEFQPRDRSRAASKAQISEIANKLNPEFLGDSPKASDGRPLVVPVSMPDGTTKYAVISGNGRTAGIRAAYDLDNERAKAYKTFAESKSATGAKQPVYVGILDPKEIKDFPEFAKQSNESATSAMSAAEQAKSDADRLDSSVLNLFVPSEDGAIHGAANREFITAFLDRTTPTSEMPRFVDANGKLSQEGITKVRNAVFAKAFGGSEMGMQTLSRMAESTDSNIKNITNALLAKSGELSSFGEAAKENRRYKTLDIAPDFARAMEKYSELKDAGTSLDEYVRQGALFGADTSPMQTRVMQVFDFYKRRSKSIRGIIDNYIKAAEAFGDPNQQNLFGNTKTPSKEEIFEGAVKHYEESDAGEEIEQVGLFNNNQGREKQSVTGAAGSGDAQKTGEKDGLKQAKPLAWKKKPTKEEISPAEKFTPSNLTKENVVSVEGNQEHWTVRFDTGQTIEVPKYLGDAETAISFATKTQNDLNNDEQFHNFKQGVKELKKNVREAVEVIKSGRNQIDTPLYSRPAPAEAEKAFFSQVEKTVADKMPNRATAEQIRAILGKSAVKKAETLAIGIEDFLAGKNSLTKNEVLDFVRANQIKVKEVVLTGAAAKFPEIQTGGDKRNYREIFVTAPQFAEKWSDGHSPYQNIENPVVRLRVSDRTGSNGEKILFVEEIQPPKKEELAKMPPILRQYAYQIGIKNALRNAAASGADRIVWTNGDQQRDRANLNNRIDRIQYRQAGIGGDKYSVKTFDRQLKTVQDAVLTEKELESNYGKTVARRIVENAVPQVKILSGKDLQKSGGGLKNLYDRTIPNLFKEAVRKFGGQTEPSAIDTGGQTETVSGVTITPAMKAALLEGQPLFHLADGEPAAQKSEINLKNLYNKDGDFDYEQVKAIADRIGSGELEITRLAPREEQGRIAGGRRNVEASVIAGADARTNQAESQGRGQTREEIIQRNVQTENRLEKYAKNEGIWFNYDEFTNKYPYLTAGEEARVYKDRQTNTVLKIIDYAYFSPKYSPLEFLDERVSLFNYLFPETKYELVGFTRDSNQRFQFIVRQAFIEGKTPTSRKVVNFMKGVLGTNSEFSSEQFANSEHHISDLHLKNLIQDKNGNVFVIDGLTELTPARLGGTRKYEDFSIKNNGQSSKYNASNLQKRSEPVLHDDLLNALAADVTLDTLKNAQITPTGFLNEAAYSIMARAHQTVFDQAEPPVFYGAYLSPSNASRVRDALIDFFASASTAEARRYADRYLDQFDASVDPKHGDAVQIVTSRNAPFGLRQAIQEERAHRADYRVGLEHSVAKSVIGKSLAGMKAVRNLQKGAYKTASDDLAAMEVAAKLFVDDNQELGLTDKQNDELAETYVTGLLDNGVTAADIEKELSPISEKGKKYARRAKEIEFQRNSGNDEPDAAARATPLSADLQSGGKIRQRRGENSDQPFAERPRNDGRRFLGDAGEGNQSLVKASPQDLKEAEKFFFALGEPLYARGTPNQQNALATIFAPIWKGNRETSVRDIATNFRRAGLLTAPKTHLRNMSSNALMQASEEAIRPLAVLADIAASAVTGKRTVQMVSLPGLMKSFAALVREDKTLTALNQETGIARAWNILKNGDISELSKNQMSEMRSGSPVLDAFVNYTFRTLGAEDALFKTYAMRRSLEESAKTTAITEHRTDKNVNISDRRRELLNRPTNEMLLEAELYADFTTFTNDNPVSEAFTDLKKSNTYVKLAAETLVPYDKTPTNVIARTLEYTPLGLGWAGKHLYDLKKGDSYLFRKMREKRMAEQKDLDANRKGARRRADLWFSDKMNNAATPAEKTRLRQRYNILKAKRNLKDVDRQIERDELEDAMDNLFPRIAQQQFARSVGRGSLGSAALGLGIYLAMNGLLSGIWDTGDRSEANEFYDRKDLGILNASLQIGGRRWSINDTPLGKVMALGASLYERSLRPPKDGESAIKQRVGDIYDVGKMTVMEQPLLSSLDDYFGSGKTAEKRVSGFLGSYVPAIAASLADVTDSEARDNSNWYSGAQNRIPGVRNYNEEAKNPREPYLENTTNRIIDKLDPFSSRPATNPIPVFGSGGDTSKDKKLDEAVRGGRMSVEEASKILGTDAMRGDISPSQYRQRLAALSQSKAVKEMAEASGGNDGDFKSIEKILKNAAPEDKPMLEKILVDKAKAKIKSKTNKGIEDGQKLLEIHERYFKNQ